MSVADVVEGHRAIAELLVDGRARAGWKADPHGYARARLHGAAGREMLAGLDPFALARWAGRRIGREGPRERDEPGSATGTRPSGLSPPSTRPAPLSPRLERQRAGRPLVGLAYRPAMFRRLISQLHLIEVWEQMVDHFLDGGDEALDAMATFAGRQPVSLHSLGLSVGSPQAREHPERLRRIAALAKVSGASSVSDHLGYSRVPGYGLPRFAPLWRVEESLDLVAGNVAFLQDALGIRVALENIALVFDPGGDIGTAEFLNEVAARTGCGVLLDITNLTLNETNGFSGAAHELEILDLDNVVGAQLAGGVEKEGQMDDSHSFPVPHHDFAWLERLLPQMPNCEAIVIERDGRDLAVPEVVDDLRRAHDVVERFIGASGTAPPTPARGFARALVERRTDSHVSRRFALLSRPRLTEPAWAELTRAGDLAGHLARTGLAKTALGAVISNAELIAFAAALGEVMPVPTFDPLTLAHTEDGYVVDIRPESGPLPVVRTTPLFEDRDVFLHTEHSSTSLYECPRYVALLTMEPPPAGSGGQTVLVAMADVQRRLSARHLSVLTQTYRADMPAAPPVATFHGERAVFSYGGLEGVHFLCLSAGANAGRQDMEAAFRAFLDALYSAEAWGMACERGDLVVWDNTRWFHGRTQTRASAGSTRHVKRVLVRDRSEAA